MTSSTPNATLLDNLRSPRSAISPIYSPSIRSSRISEDSDDSLRDLELSDGPLLAETTRPLRPRSYSVSGFDFQHDLLPLSASLSEPDQIHPESHEKRLGLVNGACAVLWCITECEPRWGSRTGIALIVGLQIGSGILCVSLHVFSQRVWTDETQQLLTRRGDSKYPKRRSESTGLVRCRSARMDRREQFRGTRILYTRKRRSASVPSICLRAPRIIPICMDSDIRPQARSVLLVRLFSYASDIVTQGETLSSA